MDINDPSQMKALFLKTAREYLATLTKHADYLTVFDKQAFEASHRAAHSLKSQCFAMGYTQTASICFHLEHLFNNCLQNNSPLSMNHVRLVKEALEALDQAFHAILYGNKEMDQKVILEKLGRVTGLSIQA